MSENNTHAALRRNLLRTVPVIMILLAAAAIVMAAVMFVGIRNRSEAIQAFEQKREQAYAMADQFELGSNTLSYEAKAFCETGDMVHFQAYMTELTVTRNRDTALQTLYRMGLSPREISRMQDAKIASDNLSNRELWAMELVALSEGVSEERFPGGATANLLTEDERSLSPEEQRALGYESVMSASYFTAKSGLDSKVRQFCAALMQHYGTSTVEVARLSTANSLTFFILIVVLVLFIVGMLILYSHAEKAHAAGLSRAMEEARAANRAKSAFLSSMSHDIRTPMNAIVGMTSMASQSLTDREYGKAAADLRIVQTSSRQLLSLINDVLDLSKIESGKMVLASEPYALPEVIRDVGAVMLPLCIVKNQQYSVHVLRLEHEFVVGDAVRLKQVLLNLLNNANKYTQPGGQIDFFVEELESGSPETGLYRFRVADNGIGVGQEKLSEIFEPFTREVSTSVNQVEGTGLGLTIVRSIADAAGGTVGVESEKGRGSVFTVTLPLRLQDEAQALQRYAALRGRRLLVVEETDGYAGRVCGMLSQAGALCERTSDSARAAQAAASDKNAFLVTLIDRESRPTEAIRQIRDAAPAQSIVLLTGEGGLKALETEARAAGADGLLEKPLFRSTLYEKILEVGRDGQAGVSPDRYLAGKRILIVDDVEINRMVAQLMLENAGAAAEQAESGRKALEMLEASAPGYYDAVLMDVMMPDMGGYEATGLIRALPRPDAAALPIIAMTANAFVEDVQKSRDAGMNAHLSKPIEPGDLRRVLTGLLGIGGTGAPPRERQMPGEEIP